MIFLYYTLDILLLYEKSLFYSLSISFTKAVSLKNINDKNIKNRIPCVSKLVNKINLP